MDTEPTRGCTACGSPATIKARANGIVDRPGVLQEIHTGEMLCRKCVSHLNASLRPRALCRSTIRWQADGTPEVATVETEPGKVAMLKLRIPHELKARIQKLAQAKGWSLNMWCTIQLHARVCGEEDAAGRKEG